MTLGTLPDGYREDCSFKSSCPVFVPKVKSGNREWEVGKELGKRESGSEKKGLNFGSAKRAFSIHPSRP